jgi:hypothetical protein
MNDPKTITRSQYLQAFALYTMACKLQADVDRFEIEMNKVLDLSSPEFTGSRISDGIYSRPAESFDLILGYMDITVEPEGPAVSNGDRQ